MIDKKTFKQLWTIIRPVKTWYLVTACLVFSVVSLFALRNNYQTMAVLRNQVYQADKDGQGVEESLQALRAYVNAHMNTELTRGQAGIYPPIQLKETYSRLVAAERARVDSVNSQVYSDAQAICEKQFPTGFSGRGRIPCIEEYVKSHGTTAKPVPKALYTFDFASPSWSPDLGGWALLLGRAFFVLAILRFGLGRIFLRNM